MIIEAADAETLYRQLIRHLHGGDERSPRGMPTLEVPNTHVLLKDARNNVIVNRVRSLNYRFMVAEWLWMLLGLEDVPTIARFNSKIAEFSDDGIKFAGAYGPMIRGQWWYVVTRLKKDPDTRQAVMTIWKPNPPGSKDIPCTVAFQFLLRDGALNLIATMRSSDVWLGFPYDLFNFSQILNAMAGRVGAEVGWLAMNLGSAHLYAQNFLASREVVLNAGHHLMSPALPNEAVPPLVFQSLVRPDRVFDDSPLCEEPWLRYACALQAKTSEKALEFLK